MSMSLLIVAETTHDALRENERLRAAIAESRRRFDRSWQRYAGDLGGFVNAVAWCWAPLEQALAGNEVTAGVG